MREFLTSSVRYLSVGSFWVVALLVLPNCKFSAPLAPGPNLNPGSPPHSSVIFCDIEDSTIARHCASPEEKRMGTALAAAAVTLNEGTSGTNIGLDFSPDALGRCGGEPEVVTFRGAFPRGYSVCVNCGDVIGTPSYANADAACVAQCEDFYGVTNPDGSIHPNNPPNDADRIFCESHARASTNFPQDGCFDDACLTGGMLRTDFIDPRQEYEPVVWQNTDGVMPTGAGNSLIRTKAFSGMFDAGAESTQVIASGDGFVEFTATEVNKTRVCGLSTGKPPNDVSAIIDFAITLFNNNGTGDIDLFESGQFRGNFGTFTAGDRFRVRVKDNYNGTAAISYSKVTGPCNPGSTCAETLLYPSLVTGVYPFRVDSSFFDVNATLTDVRLVRIR